MDRSGRVTGLQQHPVRLDVYPQHASSERLTQYMALTGSTTYFLESLGAARVRVAVLEQHTHSNRQGQQWLQRLSVLYTGQAQQLPHNILLLARCRLQLEHFSAAQQDALLNSDTAIGKLLDPHQEGLIQKHNLQTSWQSTPAALATDYPWAYCRHYQLLFRGQVVADIEEVLNHESLGRL